MIGSLTRPAGLLLFTGILIAGCRAETHGADDRPDFFDHPASATPTRQWSGGAVVLTSQAFIDVDLAEFQISIGGEAMAAERLDSANVRVLLPAGIGSGIYPVLGGVGADAPARLTEVEVVGWRGTRLASHRGCSTPVPFPEALPTGVLLANCHTDGGPVFISASGNTSWSYDRLSGNSYAPSTSYRPGVIVDAARRVARLGWGGGWTQVDTAPCCFDRQLYELSEGLWLRTGNHHTDFYRDGVGSFAGFAMESPWSLVRSRTTARATFIPDYAPGALPIIDTEAGGIVATVGGGVTRARAAAFSANDSALYVVGETSSGSDPRLLAVDPLDGSIIGVDSVRPGGFALTTHPMTAGWLYELDRVGPAWVLRVRDAETLEVLAAPAAPNPDDACSALSYPALVVDPGRRMAHVFLLECIGGHRWIDFDLLIPE